MVFKKISKKIAMGIGIAMTACSIAACGNTTPEEPTVTDVPVDTTVEQDPVQVDEPEVTEPEEVEPEEPEEEVYVKPEEYFVTVGNVETGDTIEVSSYQYVADIHNIKITDLDAFKEQINQLPNLLYIDMCDCGLTDEQMEDLQYTFPSVRFVWMLRMTNTNSVRTLWWNVRTDALAFSTLHAWASDPRLDDTQAQRLKYCEDLVALDFGHNDVANLEFMKDMDLHILITVDSFNRKEGHYLDDLSVAANYKNLMYLETFVGRISDTSFLKDLKEIVDLNLSYNPISDTTYMKDFPKIERFVLQSTQISNADYQELVELYPNAKVYNYGSGSVDQGWRSHPRYFAMIDMYRNNYWNDLFRTDAELAELATRDLLVIDGKRYYGTSYVQEMAEPEEEAVEETAEDATTDTTEVADADAEVAEEEAVEEFVPYELTDKYGNTYSFNTTIGNSVGKGSIPAENNECNFNAVGNAYSKDTGNGRILVLMEDGKYHWFYRNEVVARILNEKLDEEGELKPEYFRDKVQERVDAERAEAARLEAEAQAAAEEAARLEAEAQADAEAADDSENE